MFAYGPTISIVALDWDGTIADTFTPSPRGCGVEAGYRHALKEIFGDPELLDRIGGLRNRASREVVDAVVDLEPARGRIGHAYYDKHKKSLGGYVPKGKGIRNPRRGSRDVLTEALVRVRLQYLLPEITPEWPKPFPGVLETLELLRSRGKAIAILSSGHDAFITKTLEVWNCKAPQIIVTDDDMRAAGLPPEHSCKPHPAIMRTMLERAMHSTIMCSTPVSYRVDAHIGDCERKDRGLAQNSDVRFGWFNPKQKPAPNDFGERDEFQFWSWHDLPHLLN